MVHVLWGHLLVDISSEIFRDSSILGVEKLTQSFRQTEANQLCERIPYQSLKTEQSIQVWFLSQEGEELERLNIAKLSRIELNKLLVAKGIRTKAQQHAGHDEF